MTGFLNDLNLDDVNPDPNYIADGLYRAFVYGSEVKTKQSTGTKSWVLTYKVAPDQKHAGQVQQEWFDLDPKGENAELKRSFLKKRVLSLGVPESKIGEIQPSDLVGIEVSMKIVHRNSYQNVGEITLAGSGATPAASADVADLL